MNANASRIGSFAWPSIAGLISAGVALALAEVAAGALLVRSPVIAVGDAVIDLVPAPVKDFAIATFGTNDKLALLVGIAIALVALAIAIGHATKKSLTAGAIGVCLLCGAAMIAGAATTDPMPASLVPGFVGAVSGVAALYGYRRYANLGKTGVVGQQKGMDRRKFLKLSGGLTALAVISLSTGRWLSSRLSAAASRASVVLPRPAQQLQPVPAGTSLGVDGIAPFVTPNADFYRIDTALVVPQVPTETWNLRIHGMVDSPLELSFDDLLSRPLIERDITMTCVSNVVGGDLVGNARWLGVPVRDLLDEAGVDPRSATQIVGRSSDGYECGFPTSAAYDGRDCMVVVGMNGEPLPTEHGFPARLVTAGLYGYVSATKWLTEIEMTTLEDFDSYWVRRNWAKEAPIKTQSRIDTPRGLAKLDAGAVVIGGVAWAQTRGIERVEVQIDDESWQQAELGDELNDSTWRQWRYQWNATAGSHQIRVRATDGTGATQTEQRVDPIPDGASGWHSIVVSVTA
jgi:DMSO/TMAO reductase YedYZ molybdopterin-dependent catalytic subunit